MTAPRVTILTYCAHPALAYGTLLVFKTLRIGFPTASVEVYDNGSHPDVARAIACAAADVGATFEAMQPRHFGKHLRWMLLERGPLDGPLVILDPDVIFWERAEQWDFGTALLAGRLIPRHGIGPIAIAPRLHPSLLWVPDVASLRAAVRDLDPQAIRWEFERGQHVTRERGAVVFWDTLAPLYGALRDRCRAFSERELDAYDHLFFGSHLPVRDQVSNAFTALACELHKAAATEDWNALRGAWRKQERFFSGDADWQVGSRSSSMAQYVQERLARACEIQEWQGESYPSDDLRRALAVLEHRVHGGI